MRPQFSFFVGVGGGEGVAMKKCQTLETVFHHAVISKHFEISQKYFGHCASHFPISFCCLKLHCGKPQSHFSQFTLEFASFSYVNLLQCTFSEKHSISVVITEMD